MRPFSSSPDWAPQLLYSMTLRITPGVGSIFQRTNQTAEKFSTASCSSMMRPGASQSSQSVCK